MVYKVIVSPRAQKEIENAIDYYALHNDKAPRNFIRSLQDAYNTLEINPFFSVRYNNIRALKLKKFPYLLYYIIDEKQAIVRVLSCFQNQQNPRKRPK
jgi:toxin ParE1/3/4